MKEEPSDFSQASNADDPLLSSILELKEETSECGIKDEPAEGIAVVEAASGGDLFSESAGDGYIEKGPDKRFECPICHFGFKHNLETHLPTHTGEKPFECAQCSKRFAVPSTLAKHRDFHGDVKAFACDQCPKSFALKQQLQRHVKSAPATRSRLVLETRHEHTLQAISGVAHTVTVNDKLHVQGEFFENAQELFEFAASFRRVKVRAAKCYLGD
ncbi:Protein krueppel [Aphelenchoides avenae]|nr:Protein krueppel [Aphelenchus avenae]